MGSSSVTGPVPRSPQLCLLDQRTWPRSAPRDFPGERLIACRNPVLAADAPASLCLGRVA